MDNYPNNNFNKTNCYLVVEVGSCKMKGQRWTTLRLPAFLMPWTWSVFIIIIILVILIIIILVIVMVYGEMLKHRWTSVVVCLEWAPTTHITLSTQDTGFHHHLHHLNYHHDNHHHHHHHHHQDHDPNAFNRQTMTCNLCHHHRHHHHWTGFLMIMIPITDSQWCAWQLW